MKQDNELPLGWEIVLLKDVAEVIRGVTFPKSSKAFECLPDYVACLRTANVQKNVEWDDLWYIPKNVVKRSEQFIELEDILISTANSCELVGKVALVKSIIVESTLGAFISLIRVNNSANKKFFYYQLYWKDTQEKIRGLSSTTTNISNVSTEKIKTLNVLLPPINEQHRIVTEIEKQFSRLDEAVSALKRSQANIKRYKASVLKSAVEGKLTETWRQQHPAIESAQQLLERILKERRVHWEAAELNKMQQSGKPPKDNQWQLKYKEPVNPDITDLPELPGGWVWARLDTIASIKGGITIDRNKTASDFKSVPYLRVANVQRGYLDLSKIKEILAPEHKIKELLLQNNDILFNEGGDLDKLGRGWIWEGQINNCIHQNHVFRARLFLPTIQAKLISWWGNSFGRNYFLIAGNQTTNLASINLTVLSGFPVPLPPLNEQAQIVAEVEKRLSVAEEVEQQINRNLKRAEHLRQAILKRAFSGKLVPQNPADEPASVLLEKLNQTSTIKP